MKMKKILALLLALAMVFALAACGGNNNSNNNSGNNGGDNAVAVDKWVIPVLSARTGPVSYVGEPAIWAAQYCAEQINANGGIRGVPVEIVPYDTEFDAQVGAQIAAGLVDDSLFIVGCMAAPVSLAISQIVYDAKVPNVGSYSYQEIRDEFSPYLCGYMSDSEAGDLSAATQWCQQYGYEKIVLIYTPSDNSQAATYTLFQNSLASSAGAELVGTVEVETGTLDCGPAAIQALSYNADAYFICLRADECGKMIKELRARGVDSGNKICATFSAFGDTLLNIAGADAEGVYIWNKLDPNYSGDVWQALVEAYKPAFNGETPSVPPITGFYNALVAFKQCVEELNITGDPAKRTEERDAIANWFYNSPVIAGCQGDFQWVNGAMMSDALMFQVQSGAFVPVS